MYKRSQAHECSLEVVKWQAQGQFGLYSEAETEADKSKMKKEMPNLFSHKLNT